MIVWPALPHGQLLGKYHALTQSDPGGFSMNLQGEKVHANSGYVVALGTYDSPSEAIEVALSGVELRGVVLGYWRDEEGKEYFEVSLWTHLFGFATDLGRKKAQQAIWSFKDGEEIWLDGREGVNDAPPIVPQDAEPFSKYQSQE